MYCCTFQKVYQNVSNSKYVINTKIRLANHNKSSTKNCGKFSVKKIDCSRILLIQKQQLQGRLYHLAQHDVSCCGVNCGIRSSFLGLPVFHSQVNLRGYQFSTACSRCEFLVHSLAAHILHYVQSQGHFLVCIFVYGLARFLFHSNSL